MSSNIISYMPNPDEFENLLKNLSNAISQFASLQIDYGPAISKALSASTDTLRRVSEIIRSSNYMSSISRLREVIERASEYRNFDLQKFAESLAQDSNELNRDKVSESLIQSLPSAVEFMAPNQKDVVAEVFPEALQNSPSAPAIEKPIKKKWDAQSLIAVLDILITLIFGILSLLPSEQLDQLAEQNEIIIQQNGKIIENQSDEIAILHGLLQSAQDVNNALYDLTQDSNAFLGSLGSNTEGQDSILDIPDRGYESNYIDDQGQDNNGLENADEAQYRQ